MDDTFVDWFGVKGEGSGQFVTSFSEAVFGDGLWCVCFSLFSLPVGCHSKDVFKYGILFQSHFAAKRRLDAIHGQW